MTLGLYAAWNIAREGSLEITVNGSTLYMTTGHFAHVDASGIGVAAFPDALAALLLTTGAGWTVSFDLTTSFYTIARGGTPFTLAYSGNPASERMFELLGGMPADVAVTSRTSTRVPRRAIRPAMQCVSNWSGISTGDASERRVSDSGASYAVGPSTVPSKMMFEFTQEPKAAIMANDSNPSGYESWESFWRHAGRYQEPIVMTWEHFLVNPIWPVFTLAKPDFSERTHSLMQSDWDALWRIRIEAENVRMVGIP